VVRRAPFPASATTPLVPPLVPSAVFVARDADHMNGVYEGREAGFTYGRERSPNADLLAGRIAALEGAECGLVTSSGMTAVAAVVLGLLRAGDHIVFGNQLYGPDRATDEPGASAAGLRHRCRGVRLRGPSQINLNVGAQPEGPERYQIV
jgi:O-acetylhomoserine/O-acetylserine sulfhydrylase-like pyridoxal-dependent enzyme